MEYYAAERKKELLSFCNSMDGTGQHYAQWNKPGCERQIPYDLTFNWNLINKTNKQAKYKQRHWNKEQTDSSQRGGGRGQGGEKGEGFSGTIKDMWTKSRRVETGEGCGDGWGRGRVVAGRKSRQLYLNNNKKKMKHKKKKSRITSTVNGEAKNQTWKKKKEKTSPTPRLSSFQNGS